jgi:hypothetical protein
LLVAELVEGILGLLLALAQPNVETRTINAVVIIKAARTFLPDQFLMEVPDFPFLSASLQFISNIPLLNDNRIICNFLQVFLP